MIYLAYAVLFLSLINLFRIGFFLIASELYDIKKNNQSPNESDYYSLNYRPLVTVIVPAHNEEKTLKRNLLSIANSTYKNVEIIIVNDSSTDNTGKIALNFQRKYSSQFKMIKVLNVNVRGKARALNKGLKHAHGSLFMCLDADSALTVDALERGVKFFREKSVGALASNVKIISGKGFMNLLQRFEYAMNYQMKKAEALTRIQYIVGGIGSMYRMRIIKNMNYYDTDTITEDIDLSMKMVSHYKDKQYIGYDPSMVVFSEAVVSVKDLLKQRNRWKYGRYQVFLKRSGLFYSKDKAVNRLLSWVYLPYALFAELTFFFEPLVMGFIIYIMARYGDFWTILTSISIYCFYIISLVSGATQGYTKAERLKFIALAPVAYLLIYILSYVEYIATVKGFLNLPKLFKNHKTGVGTCEWNHVVRTG